MSDITETVETKDPTTVNIKGAGYWIGKGIATVGLWAGCAFLGQADPTMIPLALFFGFFATGVIMCGF